MLLVFNGHMLQIKETANTKQNIIELMCITSSTTQLKIPPKNMIPYLTKERSLHKGSLSSPWMSIPLPVFVPDM